MKIIINHHYEGAIERAIEMSTIRNDSELSASMRDAI